MSISNQENVPTDTPSGQSDRWRQPSASMAHWQPRLAKLTTNPSWTASGCICSKANCLPHEYVGKTPIYNLMPMHDWAWIWLNLDAFSERKGVVDTDLHNQSLSMKTESHPYNTHDSQLFLLLDQQKQTLGSHQALLGHILLLLNFHVAPQ